MAKTDGRTPPRCDLCGAQACSTDAPEAELPPECMAREYAAELAAAREAYTEPELRSIAQAAARTEAAGYCRDTRIEEVMAFARRLGVAHLGIACCIGLKREAQVAARIFSAHGFSVSVALCKAGSIPKRELGLSPEEQIRPGGFEAACNPAGQARVLDAAGCGLNVVIGLCVGHDSVFFRASRAPVTVLVAKDRVLGHNPVAAIYQAQAYYKRLLDPPEDG